jgi:putative CocE/NonD family hydrolase
MHRITDLPVRVREIENIWIPVRDGIRLAARAWLPEGAERHPVPAVLEYIPYRKRDMTALRDTATHGYLAGHSYACIRLDARGIGDSEGVYGDQFAGQYVEDAIDAIAWLAEQPWCSGAVAMFGLSWGAAIALETAARRPPSLRTIVAAAGIDDRYALRYPGGCLATATISGIVAQLSYATRPPDPAIVGERWREMWLERLTAAAPLAEGWLARPARDPDWQEAAIAADYGRIACPVLVSAGWADPAFAAMMMRTVERLETPRLGIFGPWAHRYPHLGIPGPAIDYLGETLRWLDHWLKGHDTGIMAEPRLRSWLASDFTTAAVPEDRPGRWIGTPEWPDPGGEGREYWFGRGTLAQEKQPATQLDLPSTLLIGSATGEFMPLFGSDRGPELPGDQGADDAASLVFDSPPLEAPLELLGAPLVRLAFEGEDPAGQVVVRLCEVAPDGRSRRLSWGARNLGLSDDLSALRKPGGARQSMEVEISVFPLAETLAAGHRLRIAVSTSYWPLLWPAPVSPRLTLKTAGSLLSLPVASRGDACRGPGVPRAAPTLRWTELRPGGYRRVESRDGKTGERVLTITDDMGTGRIEELGLEISEATTRIYRIRPNDPTSASIETETTCSFRRGDWSTRTTVRGHVARAGNAFESRHTLRAEESDRTVFSRRWRRRIPPPELATAPRSDRLVADGAHDANDREGSVQARDPRGDQGRER